MKEKKIYSVVQKWSRKSVGGERNLIYNWHYEIQPGWVNPPIYVGSKQECLQWLEKQK